MKRGFTLAELLGVIVLLGAILLIILPVVDKTIKESKEDLYQDQIDSLKLALQLWVSENQKPDIGETITLSLSQLKADGLVELDIKNPRTDEFFPNDMQLKIVNNEGILDYQVLEDGTNTNDYKILPSISLNGDVLEYVEISQTGSYVDKGAVAKNPSNNVINTITTTDTPTINIAQKGIYLRKYTATFDGYTNDAYRTIVVRDTLGPTISFSGNLSMTYSQSLSYNFLSGVTTTDNSGETVSIKVEKNISSIKGKYTIKYIATDSSGNETTKLREVTITR